MKFGQKFAFTRFQPLSVLSGSFAVIILVGTGLLMLPKATVEGGMRFVDALFTSTSATCVTGLIVVDTGTFFTSLGQWIILLLIQVGGLGIMTMAAFFVMILGTRLSVHERVMMRDLLSDESMAKIATTLWQVVGLTLFLEGVGVVALYRLFPEGVFPESQRLFQSVFHAVSAFSNAGFSLFSSSLMEFSSRTMLTGTFAGLILLGGLGFPVLVNVLGYRFVGSTGLFGKKQLRMNIQSHIVIKVSGVLVLAGAVWIWVMNYGIQGDWSLSEARMVDIFFQSITTRTAGFNTVNISTLTLPVLLGMMVLMFIGASPGSTGGGIKTTTFYLSIRAIWGRLTGNPIVEYRHREIRGGLLQQSMMLILAAQLVILISFILLTVTEDQKPVNLLFETISAFGTVGLSTGITPELSTTGRYIITVTMFLGRIGPLAFIIALGRSARKRNYEFPDESVMLG